MTVLDESSTTVRGRLELLVQRHMDMVYGAALRQMRDPHAASDVTQAVFLVLQNKLAALSNDTLISLWLLRTTRYACLAAQRQQRRRAHHEAKVKAMHAETQGQESADDELIQKIDEALGKLSLADRTLLVMSYFENRSHAEVGARLGISEQTARKRVQRAIEKLRKIVGRRGAVTSGVGVMTGLATVARGAATPVEVVTAVKTGILGGAVPAQVSVIAKGAMTMMKLLKLKMAAFGVLALATAGAVGAATFHFTHEPTPPVAARQEQGIPPPGIRGQDGYGSIASLTIRNDNVANQDTLADLDSGNLSTLRDLGPPRGPSAFGAAELAAEKGFDLVYEGGRRLVLGFDLSAVLRPNEEFERSSVDEPLTVYLLSASPTTVSMDTRALPVTYAIRTREGAVGILQITEEIPATDPRNTNGGIQVRVKMLRPEVRDRLAAQNAVSKLLPDLERKLEALGDGSVNEETRAAVRGLVRTARALEEIAKGTPISGAAAKTITAVGRVQEAVVPGDDSAARKAVEEMKRAMPAVFEEIRRVAAKLSGGA